MNKESTSKRTEELPNYVLLSHVRQLINEGHEVTMNIKGNSMRPLLENGRDKVTISPVPAGSLHIGDIVLAEISPDIYVLHRIIKINNEQLTLMGDGNLKGTEKCSTADVVGVVYSVIRNGRIWKSDDNKWKLLRIFWPKLKPIRRYLLAIFRVRFFDISCNL